MCWCWSGQLTILLSCEDLGLVARGHWEWPLQYWEKSTLEVSIMFEVKGSQKWITIFWNVTFLNSIIGKHESMRSRPISKHFAWALNLKEFLPMLGCFVIVESMRIFLPGKNLKVESMIESKIRCGFAWMQFHSLIFEYIKIFVYMQ